MKIEEVVGAGKFAIGDILDLQPAYPKFKHILGRIERISDDEQKYKLLIVVAAPEPGYKPPLKAGDTISSDYKYIRNRKVVAKSN
jgi:hypothetical protein